MGEAIGEAAVGEAMGREVGGAGCADGGSDDRAGCLVSTRMVGWPYPCSYRNPCSYPYPYPCSYPYPYP